MSTHLRLGESGMMSPKELYRIVKCETCNHHSRIAKRVRIQSTFLGDAVLKCGEAMLL